MRKRKEFDKSFSDSVDCKTATSASFGDAFFYERGGGRVDGQRATHYDPTEVSPEDDGGLGMLSDMARRVRRGNGQ